MAFSAASSGVRRAANRTTRSLMCGIVLPSIADIGD